MVRLASIEYEGKIKFVAQLPSGYCDLSSIADNARDFFLVGGLERAKELVTQALSSPTSIPNVIPADGCRLLAPIDGSLVGKFLCVGMNYKVG